MKILFLNTWGGRAGHENMLSFFKKFKDQIDIFCLQEMWSGTKNKLHGELVGGQPLDIGAVMTNGVQQLDEIFDNHQLFFHPHFEDNYGLVMFVKKDFKILDSGDIFVHKDREYIVPEGVDVGHHARNIQYVSAEIQGKKITVVNFHGLWNGQGKGDSDDRLLQSENIIAFLKDQKNPAVLGGDFNLSPDTESIKKFTDFGLRNLIAEYGITSTRTSLYLKENKFANYVFISSEITIKNFQVLPDEVSDHAALLIEIEL